VAEDKPQGDIEKWRDKAVLEGSTGSD
jgi:hypothetical protein